MKKSAVLGTAGHVDHGKTSLIKALTGVDCDTHKEEKKRGITINLGFTYLENETTSISIVDMPGHSDFVKTMVAGASGIDLFLLVVDSESGIMPQTIEHLQILKIMGVTSGVVAFTKSDLVEEDMVVLLQEELKDYHSLFPFLIDSPVVSVSAKSGDGVPELRDLLFSICDQVRQDKRESLFRLYIDRLFTIKGAGTIIAGSVLGGEYEIGEALFLNPGGEELKVRAMEKHGKEVGSATAGDRISLNITGIKREFLSRGMQISSSEMAGTKRIDALLHLFDDQKPIVKSPFNAIFLVGSCEVQAKINLIDKKRIESGEEALVQVSFEQELFLQPGDSFVIRNSSDERCLGGGDVIDPAPLHHRKKPEYLIRRMSELSNGNYLPKLEEQMDYINGPVSIDEIAGAMNISPGDFIACLPDKESCGVSIKCIDGVSYAIKDQELKRWRKEMVPAFMKYHSENPLSPGIADGSVYQLLGASTSVATKELLKSTLQALSVAKKIIQQDGLWFAAGHVNSSSAMNKEVKIVDDFIRQTKQSPPTLDVVCKRYPKISKTDIIKILKLLMSRERVFLIEDRYLHSSVLNKYSRLFFTFQEKEEKVSRIMFRDYIESGRRFASAIIDYLEMRECITKVEDQLYTVTEKGELFKEELVKK